ENVYDRFVELFKEATLKVTKVGDPWKDDISQGPQVSQAQFDLILSYIESGKREGATVSLGGKAIKSQQGKGFFIEPTVFTQVTDNMAIYREEIFGPVVVICSFKTEAEAISRANDTTYGLGAAVFTENGARGHRVARKIQAGSVWINSSNNADYRVPFGGLKQSGIGSDCGEAALLGYTVLKSIYAPLQ
ncbi:mitochondrial aldehyde dehydrogenase, partial [Exophiala xenobiotica]